MFDLQPIGPSSIRTLQFSENTTSRFAPALSHLSWTSIPRPASCAESILCPRRVIEGGVVANLMLMSAPVEKSLYVLGRYALRRFLCVVALDLEDSLTPMRGPAEERGGAAGRGFAPTRSGPVLTHPPVDSDQVNPLACMASKRRVAAL